MAAANQPAKYALVLGGGGTTGIAWETGLLLGLADGGIDVSTADLVIGTSAGSTVGAQITSGHPLEELYARQLLPLEQTREQAVQLDMETLFKVFTAGAGAPDAQTASARAGAAALAAKTMPEAERLEIIAARLPEKDWPAQQRLLIVAVNAQTGETALFDKDAAVTLTLAVAASCAVPGIYPPVTIGDQRYIDGGVRSGTNADYAKGSQRVLIVRAEAMEAPPIPGAPPTPHLTFEEELAALEASGAQVFVITPDQATTAARGPNPLDASRREGSAKAGRAQGRQIAEQVRRFWSA